MSLPVLKEPLTFEGSDENRRIILIQFSSPGKAKEFYSSPEYQKARNLLKEAAAGEMRVADGLQYGRIGGNSPEQKKRHFVKSEKRSVRFFTIAYNQ